MRSMRSVINRMNFRKSGSIVLIIIVAGITVFYFFRHGADFRLMTEVTIWPVAVVSVLKLFEIYIRGRELKVLTDHYHLNLSFSQWFGLTRVMAFANLFFPSLTGASIKAFYLKKFHNLSYSSFVALLGIANILRLMLYAAMAFTLILLSGKISPILLTLSGLLFLCSVTFLLFGHRLPLRLLVRTDKLSRVLEEWKTVRRDRSLTRKIMGLQCCILICYLFQIHFSFLVFMKNASLLTSGIISSFTVFSRVVKIIPANIGVKEAIFSALSDFYGQGINEGLHAAALDRIIGIFFILLLAPGFIPALLNGKRPF